MQAQHWTWLAGGGALFLAIFAGVADWRRTRRKRIDDYGWMPWRGIQVMAMLAVLAIAMIAVRLH